MIQFPEFDLLIVSCFRVVTIFDNRIPKRIL